MKLHGTFALFIAATSITGCWTRTSNNGDRGNSVNYSSERPNTSIKANANSSNSNMSESNTTKIESKAGFTANLPDDFQKPADEAGRTLFKEYGAVFVAKGSVIPPKKVVFRDSAEVSSFQATLTRSSENIGGFSMELQAPAMTALKAAIDDAKSQGLSITPRDKDSAKRSYDETIELWASRVDPALKHWVGLGKITQSDADRIKSLSPYEQVPEVFKLEAKGIWFAKDLSKSIIYSVAPPGTSQHLSLLAFDVKEHENEKVRAVLAKQGWYQTVTSDLPHFTFLGVTEDKLAGLGLKRVADGGRTFWMPDF